MNSTRRDFDIAIAGGGAAGLAAALALRSELGPSPRLAIFDPAFASPRASSRAAALAAGPRRMLATLGVWDRIAGEAQPIREMIVTDSRQGDVVRPPLLRFSGEVGEDEPFAHMLMNDVLTDALADACAEAGVVRDVAGVVDFVADASSVALTLGDGASRRAGLLVIADGGRSRLRAKAGVRTIGRDYGQSGVVATLALERDHEGRAVQHFLPAGTFALLPLTGRRASIVWTERTADADALVARGEAGFLDELYRRVGRGYGAISLLDRPRAFPLALRLAETCVGERFALVGDAAHVVHPLAGQGLNLGLRDAAVLAERLADAMRLGADPGAREALLAYRRARRFDSITTGLTMDALNRLFSNDVLALRLMRDLGLGLVDRLPGLKRGLMREAAGLAGARPRLFDRAA